jgi:hypothetical protein
MRPLDRAWSLHHDFGQCVARAGIGLLRERRIVENKRDGHGRTAGH